MVVWWLQRFGGYNSGLEDMVALGAMVALEAMGAMVAMEATTKIGWWLSLKILVVETINIID